MFYNRVYAIDADVKDFRVVVKGSVERDYDFVLLDYFVLLHFYLRVQTERGGVTVRIITVTNDKILVWLKVLTFWVRNVPHYTEVILVVFMD